MSRDWLFHTGAVLSGAGLKTSAGRTAVIELLAREDCLLSAQDVIDRLRGEASAATVYRALETLHSYGLIRRFDATEGASSYERVEPSGEHHHHVVFDDGAVEPFEDADLEHVMGQLGSRLGLDLTGHDVILRARRR